MICIHSLAYVRCNQTVSVSHQSSWLLSDKREIEDRGTNKYNLRLQSLDTRRPIPTIQPSVMSDILPL